MPRRKAKVVQKGKSTNSLDRTNGSHSCEIIDAFLQKTRHTKSGQKLSFKTLFHLANQLHKCNSLNVQDECGRTLLMHSVLHGSEKSVDAICSLGADVNLKDNDGRTALMFVFISELKFSAKTLCNLIGENPCAQDKYGKSALMYAFEKKFILPLHLVKLLFGRAFLVYHLYLKSFLICDIPSETFLGDITNLMSKTLIEENINLRDKNGKTVLMYALEYFVSEKQIEELLSLSPDVGVQDNDGRTALMHAVSISALLSKTVFRKLCSGDVNKQDRLGRTAFMYAIHYKASDEVLKFLVQCGSDINIQDNAGQTVIAQLISNRRSLCFLCEKKYSETSEYRLNFWLMFRFENYENNAIFHNCKCRFETVKLILESIPNLILSKENRILVTKMLENLNFNYLCFKNKSLLQLLLCHSIFLKTKRVQRSQFQETSYLLIALELGHLDLAKYLMANYCMTNKDLKFLKTLNNSTISIHRLIFERRSNVTKETITFVDQVMSQPWPLVSLALLAISSTISLDENRIERVSELPIPQIMKNYLMFRSPEASIPVDKWSEISLFTSRTSPCTQAASNKCPALQDHRSAAQRVYWPRLNFYGYHFYTDFFGIL